MKKNKSNKVKKNKSLIIIMITILLLIFLIGIILFIKSKQLEITTKKDKNINIYEKVYDRELIKKVKNGKIVSKKKLIDTRKLGKKNVTIEVKNYFNKIKKYTYTVNIVDKEKPIINFQEKLITEVGNEIDLLKDVTVSDNSKEELTVAVVGDYSFNEVGTYELTYVSKDSSKNEAKEKFILEVVEKEKEVINRSPTISSKEFTTSKGFKGVVKNGITYIDGIMIANKTYPLPDSYNPGGLTSETKNAFDVMASAASNEGISLWIASGFRSYSRQKALYNNYVNQDGKEEADTYSARPGHSEHQTGLAFDLNQVDRNFGNTPEGIWLAKNAWKYGFILRYPEGKTNETGYIYESWHFRYVGNTLAEKLYNNGNWITLESYFGISSEYTY